MSSPFTDLANAMAPYLGGSVEAAGFVLGTITIVALVIALEWAFGSKSFKGHNDSTFIVTASMGYIFAVLVGWYPLWSVIVIMFIILFVMFNPFSGGKGAET